MTIFEQLDADCVSYDEICKIYGEDIANNYIRWLCDE